MFDFVRKHTRVLQLLLLILILPSFVVFGIQGYDRFMSDDGVVAKVGSQKITQGEWDAANRTLTERIRAQSPEVDAKLFDTPEFKKRSLDSLLRDYTLSAASREQHLRTPDSRLTRLFMTLPDFASLRDANGNLNAKLLEAQGLNSVQFTERLREQISVGQVLSGIESTVAPSKTATKLVVESLFQSRDLQWMPFDPKKYAEQLNPTPEQLKAFFNRPDMAAAFMLPERADVQYVVLDLDSLKQRVSITEDELRKSYQENLGRFTKEEERRASHILIKAEKSASPAQRQAARAKAEKLLAEVNKNPAQFAELAKKNSEDAGSAVNGGDLDFFSRGAMVKPFEDAAFSLKQGQISGVVESDFGYHIIMLTGVRGGAAESFEAVRGQIEDDARKELARKMYAEAAEKFTNTVYEQADSLKPVADELKLTVQSAAEILHKPGAKDQGALGNARVLDALFDASNRSKARNTEALEIAPNKLVSARIVKYYPAAKPAFEQAQAQLRERWIQVESLKAAKADAEQKLALWKQSPDKAQLPASIEVSRKTQFSQPAAVLDAALRIPESQLPAWKTVDLGAQGVALMRVNKVLPLKTTPEESIEAMGQLSGLWGKAEADAYLHALQRELKAKVVVKTPAKADAEKTPAGS
jgi:peptidyl-prolyl cis-trans isomerase D